MKLTQLEYFCTAVQCGSITQAAKKLYVTQPAISGAIRELEKEFSVALFTHSRNKLSLTEDGQRFYDRAEQLLREVSTATQQLHDLGTLSQPVCVGIPPLRPAPIRHPGRAGRGAHGLFGLCKGLSPIP